METINIEQLKELEEGKVYYIRFPDGTPLEEIDNFSKAVANLNLKSLIIIGVGNFDIEDVSDQVDNYKRNQAIQKMEGVIEINIKLFEDGDSYCALIGKCLQEGIAGFSEKPINALRSLCDELESIISDDNINLIGEY